MATKYQTPVQAIKINRSAALKLFKLLQAKKNGGSVQAVTTQERGLVLKTTDVTQLWPHMRVSIRIRIRIRIRITLFYIKFKKMNTS